ncbi:MAG: hypothetical protein COB53_10450 [Elusimicrobia bacterium]|nr:MAG: hypothetical protein COB53_10450 [Elusimicrobiota bacterium]
MRVSLALLLLAASVHASPVKSGPRTIFDLERVGDGVYAAIARRPAPPAVSNAAFIILSDGVLVVDSHLKPEASKVLLREIKKITDKPVRYLVQTHHHSDHVGGNTAFPGAIDIIAHKRTRNRLKRWNPTKARLPDLVLKDEIIFHRGRELQVLYVGRGHTDGDIVVWLPTSKILITGDLLFHGRTIGFMKDGFVGDWIQTMDSLVALKPESVVPGHGPLAGSQDLLAFKSYLIAFLASVQAHFDRGESLEKTLLTYRLPKAYRDWGMQDMALASNIKRVWKEIKRAH